MTFTLDGDLTAEVDGVTVHLRASGQHVVVTSEEPAGLRRATNVGPRGLGTVAALLDEAGLTVTLRTAKRDVVRLGAGIDTVSGRVLTRNRRVALGPGALPLVPRRIPIGVLAAVLIAVGYAVLPTMPGRKRPDLSAPDR